MKVHLKDGYWTDVLVMINLMNIGLWKKRAFQTRVAYVSLKPSRYRIVYAN